MARAARRPSTALRRLTLRPRRAATPTRSPLSRHPSAIVRRPIAARMLRPASSLSPAPGTTRSALCESVARVSRRRGGQDSRRADRAPERSIRSNGGTRSARLVPAELLGVLGCEARRRLTRGRIEPFPFDGRTFRRPCPRGGSSPRMLGGREADELRAGGVRGLPCVRPAPLRRAAPVTCG